MISDLDIRFSAMLEPIHCAAAMLDPQTKGKCLSDEDRMRAMEFIHSIFEQHPIFKTESKKYLNQNSKISYYIQVNIVQDLANYLSNEGYWSHRFLWDVEKIQISPLSWWKGLCGTTALSKIAELILTSPISSVATERSFKTFSDTHTKKRNRLDSKKASKVSFANILRKLVFLKLEINYVTVRAQRS
ncbi:uncharacterized protein LOC135838734 [Planococcus citri]|uniref:uncharacterized protein LOC135838734 n=1 Tax=Planococcus citri TaxID=170843 RepID=UPI0031F850D8